jgi:hypothetical protein
MVFLSWGILFLTVFRFPREKFPLCFLTCFARNHMFRQVSLKFSLGVTNSLENHNSKVFSTEQLTSRHFYVGLGREICSKSEYGVFFSLLLQSLVLVWQLCTPLFYAPWQHFDGLEEVAPSDWTLVVLWLCLVCAQCIAWLSRSQP